MKNRIEYKGFVGTVEYCNEDHIYHGNVEGLPKTWIMYHGSTMEELQADFIEAVEFHLLPDCEEDIVYNATALAKAL